MKRRDISSIIFDILNYFVMGVLLIIFIYPIVYIISYSLSDASRISGGLLLLPKGFNLDSYKLAFANPAILRGLFISIARTVAGPIIMVFFTSMAAYCMTRDDMLGIKFLRRFFVLTLYFSSGLIPMYLLMNKLRLPGTFFVYIIPTAFSVFNMILIKTFIEGLPKELEESASIDGADDIIIFWKVIFPICTPVIAAVILFDAVAQWNAFMDTQLYNSMNRELYTLQYVLYQAMSATVSSMQSNTTSNFARMATPQSFKMAITLITILPIMFVYPFLQKHFAKGLLVGSVKG